MLQNITLNPYKAQGLLTDFHLLWKCVGFFIYLLTTLFCLNSNSAHSLVQTSIQDIVNIPYALLWKNKVGKIPLKKRNDSRVIDPSYPSLCYSLKGVRLIEVNWMQKKGY